MIYYCFFFLDLSSHNHTEGHLNDQFSQLGLNNVPLLSPVQNNALVCE